MAAECNICSSVLAHTSIGIKLYDTVLFESENFITVPTKSPMVEGWLLIFPKKHFLSLADLPTLLLDELAEFSTFVKNRIEEHYSPCIIVEQGPTQCEQPTGCGVDHAHLHIIPIGISSIRDNVDNILGTKKNYWIDNVPITSLSSIRYIYKKSYFFIAERESGSILFQNEFPSQLLRRAISINSPNEHRYDWRTFEHTSTLQNTIRTLSKKSQVLQSSFAC